MKRRILSLTVVFAMILTVIPTFTLTASAEFSAANGGDGTDGSPYEINTLEQLEAFREYINNGNGSGEYFKLTAPIDMSANYNAENGTSWTPIGNDSNKFQGTFDGGKFTISELYINTKEGHQGLFGDSYGTIKNLTVSGSVSGNGEVGGIVGENYGGSILNCRSDCAVSGSGNYVGGIAGYHTGTIKNCYNTGTVNGGTGGDNDYVGGIAGNNSGSIENCHNAGTIKGTGSYTGGVVGENKSSGSGNIKNCYNEGTVNGVSYTGGIAGNNDSAGVESCYNTGTVSGSDTIGGIVGNNTGNIKNCYYLNSCGAAGDYGTSKTEDAFNSGEVTWSLQNGQGTQAWGQKLGDEADKYPLLTSEESKKVLKVTFAMQDNPNYDIQYINLNGKVTPPKNPEKDNYMFEKWAKTQEAEGEEFDTSTSVTEDMTVYAVGQEKFGGDSDEIPLSGIYGYEAPLTINLDNYMKYANTDISSESKFAYIIASDENKTNADIVSSNTLSVPTGLNVGDYTIKIKAAEKMPQYSLMSVENFGTEDVTLTVKVSIAKADSTATVTAADLTYTGSEQNLVSGSAEGGTLQYATSQEGVYSEDIPTGINAQDYEVWYKVVGDSNHNNIEPTKVENVEIKKANSSLTSTPTAKDLTYDGTAQELVTAGEATGGQLQYKVDEGTYSTDIPKGTEAKTYTVYYKVVENENYNGIEETSISVEIKAQQEATPNIVIDYETEQLTGFDSSATYQITGGSDISNTVTDATTASAAEYMGKGELSIVRKARNDNYADSTAQSLTVPARLGEPSVDGAAPTTHDGNGKITGADETMEYREKTDGNTEAWKDCTEGEIEVAPNKTYEVRKKAVAESAFASEIKEVNVPKFEPAEITGEVTIDGDAMFGETLTAVTTEVVPSSINFTYKWQRSGDDGYTDISGATESTYKITTEDIGKTIQVVVTADNPDYTGSLTSTPTGEVEKATISGIEVAANPSITAYTGSEQTLVTVSGNEVTDTIEYKVEKKGSGEEYSQVGTENKATDAGTYKVTVTVKRNGYNDYTGSAEVTIAKADSSVTAPTAKTDLTYDGTAQELLDSKGSANGGELQYSLDNESYSTDVPKGTEAKTYTVWYKVVGDSNHNDTAAANITVEIAKATPTFPTVEAVNGGKYEPDKKLSSVEVPTVDGGTLAWSDENTVLTAGENRVQAVFTPENSENYNPTTIEGTVTVNVAKADSSVTAPTPKTDLTYNGEAQELLETAGSATGGQLQYKVDEGEYSTAAPTAITAGEHTVYYKVVENDNYNGIDEASITVTIAKATPVFPEVDEVDGGTYTPNMKLSDVTVPDVEGGTLAWSDGETALNAGANSVQAVFTPANSENYEPTSITDTVTVNVAKATITGVRVQNVTAQFDEAEPTKQYALAAPTGTIEGDVVSYAEGDYDAETDESASWQETCPSYSDEGTNQTITVRIERANYNNLYLKATIKITNEPLIDDVTVTANEGLVYNGGAQELVTVTGALDSDTVTYYVNDDPTGSTEKATGTNAGDYSVKVTVERAEHHTFEKTVDVTISKATPTFPEVAAVDGGIYAPDKKLGSVELPTVEGGTLAWSDENAVLTAGENSAQAVFTPSDKANYEDTTVTGTVTVNVAKATITDVEVQDVSVQFDETEPEKLYTLEAPTGTVEGDVVSYAEGEYNAENDSEADWKETCPSYSAENTNQTITVKIERENYNTLYLTATINIIGEPTIDNVNVTANSGLVYNGGAQELVTVTGALETDTVTYYVNDDPTGSTEKATGTNAGSYSVKVKVEREGYHHFEKTVEVTIAKATPTFPTVEAVDGGIYEPEKKLGSVEVPTVDGGTLAWSDADTALTAGENSVQAVFTPSDKVNYEDTTVTGTVTVNVAKATITAADVVISGDGDITHDGAAHGLTVTLGGSAEGGTVKYIEGEYNVDTDTELAWLDACPTVTEVGDTKTITVKVSKENYDDYYTTKTITITDEPMVSDITVTPYSGTYDGEAHNAVTVEGAESTDTIKYQLDGSETASVPQITDAGTYSVTVTVERAGYHPYTTTVDATIAQAESTFPTVEVIDVTYTEGITLADVELPTVTDGTLSWADETTAVIEGTSEYDAVFTPTDAVNYKAANGKITVTATAEVTPSPSPSPEPSTAFDVTGTVKNNDGTAAANRKITLKPLGLETTTDEGGNYAFNGVEAGSYNIVVETGDGKTVTTLVDVTDDNVSADITLPAANVGSAVEATDSDNSSDIKVEDIVVGGLDALAEAVAEALPEADKTKNIEVKMTVESKKESSTDTAQQAIKQQSKNKAEKLDYIDIDIIKTVGTESENVTETTNLITIIIPFVTDGKKDITVYRYHDGEAAAMTEGGTGERYEVGDGVITIYTQKFSTYAIAYNDRSTTPTPTPDTGSTSRSGSGSSSYTVQFETNGGSKVTSQSISRNGVVKEPIAPTKDGYTFAGWYTDKALTTEYNFASKVTSNFTLYAKWNEDKTDNETETTPAPTDEPQKTAKSMPFMDVNTSDWFYNNVKYVYENGLMNGVSGTEFAPNETITRGMFVTILYRMDGEPSTGASAFADVSSDAYYANAVAWANANGIVKGYSDTEYAPDDAVTREQAAAILFRYASYKGEGPTGAWAIRLDYPDIVEISDWATEGVMFCTMKNIMAGRDSGEFDPQSDITRAEGAAVFERYLNMAE